jgi:hypothetical protein
MAIQAATAITGVIAERTTKRLQMAKTEAAMGKTALEPMREEFEARRRSEGYTHGELDVRRGDDYSYPGMQDRWLEWQAAYHLGAREALEKAAKAVCGYCNAGVPFDCSHGCYLHVQNGSGAECHASAIRSLLSEHAKEK